MFLNTKEISNTQTSINILTSSIYSIPNPSALLIAMSSLSRSLFCDLYGGRRRWLKHVWAIGSLAITIDGERQRVTKRAYV
jgi:hypothetical protein